MPNTYFQFQKFRIKQELSGMKVTTDACLFGAWVADQLKRTGPSTILDIGTGTGLLSLMAAQKTDTSQIHAVEINSDAYVEARDNFESSPWNDRLTVFHQSISDYSAVPPYDVIMSNPPFYQSSQQGQLARKNQALHAGPDFMETLAKKIDELLAPDGTCYLLYPAREMDQFEAMASSHGLHLTHRINVYNREEQPIFRSMAAFQKRAATLTEETLVIRHADGKYTDSFWHLLRTYYLEYNDPKSTSTTHQST